MLAIEDTKGDTNLGEVHEDVKVQEDEDIMTFQCIMSGGMVRTMHVSLTAGINVADISHFHGAFKPIDGDGDFNNCTKAAITWHWRNVVELATEHIIYRVPSTSSWHRKQKGKEYVLVPFER